MEVDPAGQLERIVALIGAHPFIVAAAVAVILLILGFQKDGLFSKIFAYLQSKTEHETALEQRRMEIIYMMENRRQHDIPGLLEGPEKVQ